MQVLTSADAVSRPFDVQARSFVRIEGGLGDTWNIQSRRKDDASAPWENENETPLQVTQKNVTIQGALELEYRINLGTGNEGPNAFVYEAKGEIFK